jgi:hypothetical protein
VVVLDLVVVVLVLDFCSVNKLLVHQHNLFYTQMYDVLVLHYPHSHHYNQFEMEEEKIYAAELFIIITSQLSTYISYRSYLSYKYK